MPIREEPIRRLKSAPLVRSLPPPAVLTIPDPRFVAALIPVPKPDSPPSRPKTRASSAKVRMNTTLPNENTQSRREIKSAQGSRGKKII